MGIDSVSRAFSRGWVAPGRRRHLAAVCGVRSYVPVTVNASPTVRQGGGVRWPVQPC